MYLLWVMEPGPISHPEVFFEVLFCPNFQSRAMGRPSLHSLYWLHYSEQSPEAVLPLSLPVCGLGTWSPSCCHSSPLTRTCYCTDSFCNYFALIEKMKIVIKQTDTCSWCDLWGKGLVLHLSLCLAWFCLLSSIRPVREPTASRSCSTLAWLRNQKWACEVQDYTPGSKAAVKPETNTGNVNKEAKQRNSSSFKTVRCEKVLILRVRTSGGKGEVASLS